MSQKRKHWHGNWEIYGALPGGVFKRMKTEKRKGTNTNEIVEYQIS